MAGGRVFINYRRDDSRADAGRIYDRLRVRYPGRVFRDVGSLEPGVEWREAIEKVLSASDACVVVIGRNWLTMTDASGRRRLEDPRDTVRMEVLAALQNKMRVIPVLVGGAAMPAEEDLPEELQALCRRNALQISEQDWDEDMAKLARALDQALGLTSQTPESSHPRAEVHAKVSFFHGRFAFAFTGILGMCLLAAVVVSYNRTHDASPGPLTASNSGPSPAATATPSGPDSGGSGPPPAAAESHRPQTTASSTIRPNPSAASAKIRPASPAAIPAAPQLPAITASSLTGGWQARGTDTGGQLADEFELYPDGSFGVVRLGQPGAVGEWRYDAATRSIELVNGANIPNAAIRFSCLLGLANAQVASFQGPCRNNRGYSWSVELTRQNSQSTETRPLIPGLNLSSLSLAESYVFAQMLASERCTCGCGLNLLACRRSETERCMLSLNVARLRLQQFYYNLHR
jgi:TIR domain